MIPLKVRGVMTMFNESISSVLAMEEFFINPELAGLIPTKLAIRYHTLPVADKDGCVYIVMADPQNNMAREIICNTVGRPVRILQGEQKIIDAYIAELWPDSARRHLHILVLIRENSELFFATYGRALGAWLKADEVHLRGLPSQARNAKSLILDSCAEYDLVISEDLRLEQLRDRVRNASKRRWLLRSGTSILLAYQPAWPITKIVCLLRGQASDLVSAQWVARLAYSTDCAVEILVFVPQIPLMYSGLQRMHISLDEILRGNSLPGRKLRHALNYLKNWNIRADVRLFHGYSPLQIKAELERNAPELVILSDQELGSYGFELIDVLCTGTGHSLLVVRSPSSEM
jgi:hypothetical protein